MKLPHRNARQQNHNQLQRIESFSLTTSSSLTSLPVQLYRSFFSLEFSHNYYTPSIEIYNNFSSLSAHFCVGALENDSQMTPSFSTSVFSLSSLAQFSVVDLTPINQTEFYREHRAHRWKQSIDWYLFKRQQTTTKTFPK